MVAVCNLRVVSHLVLDGTLSTMNVVSYKRLNTLLL